MNLSNIKNVASRLAGRTGLIIGKYSPEILMSVGVVGIIASTVMACKATLKVEAIIEDSKIKLDKIKFANENVSKETYSEKDYRQDLIVQYTQSSMEFIKLYGPAALVLGASIACILSSHGLMKKRNLALIGAYKAIEKGFMDYRKRVVEEFGEEKDRLLKNGIKQSKVSVVEIDENGKTKTTKKTVETVDPDGISEYSRIFNDKNSTQWSNTSDYNRTFLNCQQNYANDLLRSRGHVFLNEVYDMLGLKRSQAGAVVGWVGGVGDDFIDFGMYDSTGNLRGLCEDNGILLDFNVSGVIYDTI